MKNLYKKGVTIIELMFVFALFAILIAVVLPQFSQLRENQTLKAATSDILSTLARARSQTLASFNSSEYGVHFQSDSAIIFKGKVYSAGASDNETVSMIFPISITNVTLAGAGGTSGDMYFSRIYGVPSKTGTITVSSTSTSKTITISATGGASVN